MFDEFKRFSGEDWAYTYNFSQFDATYKNYAKYMILRQLFNHHNRFTTVKAKYYVVKGLIRYLTENHTFYPNLIDIPFLEEF